MKCKLRIFIYFTFHVLLLLVYVFPFAITTAAISENLDIVVAIEDGLEERYKFDVTMNRRRLEEMPSSNQELSSNEAVACTYSELNDILSTENEIDTVYLCGDIEMIGLIRIHPSKQHIIIDGTYQGIRYSLIDANNNDGFFIDFEGCKSIVVKNIDISGRNSTGVVYAPSRNGIGLVVGFDNVNYIGAQTVHAPYAKVIYTNSNISTQTNGTSTANYVAEISQVEFYGVNRISTDFTLFPAFVFYQRGSLILHEDAKVIVEDFPGEFIAGSGVDIILYKGAVFRYENVGVDTNFSHDYQLRTLTLHEDSLMKVSFTNIAENDYLTNVFRIEEEVILKANSKLIIDNNRYAGSTLVYAIDTDWVIDGGTVAISSTKRVGTILKAHNITLMNGGALIVDVSDEINFGFDINQMSIDATSVVDIYVAYLQGILLSMGNTETEYSTAYSLDVSGVFKAKINSARNATALIMAYNEIYINEDATFHLSHTSGTVMATIIGFVGTNLESSLIRFDKPKSVFLYSPTTRLITYKMGIPYQWLEMEAKQINYWESVPAYPQDGIFDDAVETHWKKEDGSNFYINGELMGGIGTGNELINIQSNWNNEDINPNGNYSMNRGRVLTMGYIPVEIEYFSNETNVLEGSTEPYANIRVRFNTKDSEEYITLRADETGYFSYPLGVQAVGTVIYMEVNKDFLYESFEIIVSEEGTLYIEVIPKLEFLPGEVSSKLSDIALRKDDNWYIVIQDDRHYKSNWKLMARLEKNPTAVIDGVSYELENSLIYLDEHGNKSLLCKNTEVLIYYSDSKEAGKTLQWEVNQGFLLEFIPSNVFKDSVYQAVIEWTLVDAP